MNSPATSYLPGFDENDDPDDYLQCQHCGQFINWFDCDSIGACPGNAFCLNCDTEIDGDGKRAEWCGTCNACLYMEQQGCEAGSPSAEVSNDSN